MVIGVIDPQDIESARIALIDQPAEISEMINEPEARNRQGDGRVGDRRLEPEEKGPVERQSARAEVAGQEIARRRAVGQPGVLKKAAVDETRRRRRIR